VHERRRLSPRLSQWYDQYQGVVSRPYMTILARFWLTYVQWCNDFKHLAKPLFDLGVWNFGSQVYRCDMCVPNIYEHIRVHVDSSFSNA
jgi:hypothetical protein